MQRGEGGGGDGWRRQKGHQSAYRYGCEFQAPCQSHPDMDSFQECKSETDSPFPWVIILVPDPFTEIRMLSKTNQL